MSAVVPVLWGWLGAPGVTAAEITIPKGSTEGEIELRAAFSASSPPQGDLDLHAAANAAARRQRKQSGKRI